MYVHGKGVPQDYGEAVRWFREAANQGDAGAQTNLGIMYFIGEGMLRDLTQAYMWYDLASSRFPPGAAHDGAVRNRDFVAKHMTPAQIAEAQRLAREWKPKK
ncbi:MAG: sel1 repeat family protein, partial [Gemmatimonadetes bacterium]|nr:sel1 repeat family protein [Gemmatimonadota bacterium]